MGDIDVSTLAGITQDSREVQPGYLFAAFPGATVDGRDFIPQAIQRGATHVLTTLEGFEKGSANEGVQIITDENPRKKLAKLAAEFYGVQPENIVAITGTNGKTSVAHFTQQLFEMAGHPSASLGTLGIHGADVITDRVRAITTPYPVTLHKELAALAGKGITHLAMEASSHGLHQYRLDGVKLKAAAFTNLTQDHLDYHKTMDAYFSAKRRLFSEILDEKGTVVLNADDECFADLQSVSKNIISYGRNGADIKILDIKNTAAGQMLTLQIFGKNKTVELPLIGLFQAYNALCALGLVLSQNPDFNPAHLENLKSVPGRLESVQGHPAGARIFVDYAHTPDALKNVLETLRPHAAENLICIAGCGGDRDKSKRPIMGKIASQYADHLIITDDNPRSEDPAEIRAQMKGDLKGENIEEIGNRGTAIDTAIHNLKAGDVLVIAGKGHEQGQNIKGKIIPFDDVSQAKKSIQKFIKEQQ